MVLRAVRVTMLRVPFVQRGAARIQPTKKLFYTGNPRGFIGWPVEQVMKHLLAGDNFALLSPKITADEYGALWNFPLRINPSRWAQTNWLPRASFRRPE